MARPKLPVAQRKGLVMTVRMRLDLNEGLAAVAVLRGTTKSGLVSQTLTALIGTPIHVVDDLPHCF